jgi:hypothetical protein
VHQRSGEGREAEAWANGADYLGTLLQRTRSEVKTMSSPVQRSLAHLRKNGWTACVVEKWLPPRGTMKFGRRIDAYGFGDLLACRRLANHFSDRPPWQCEIALVQTTTKAHMAEHKAKILAIPEFHKWKEAGGIVLLMGWRKIGKRGQRKTWQVSEESL